MSTATHETRGGQRGFQQPCSFLVDISDDLLLLSLVAAGTGAHDEWIQIQRWSTLSGRTQRSASILHINDLTSLVCAGPQEGTFNA